jgi:RNA polymerase sigma-54 factor
VELRPELSQKQVIKLVMTPQLQQAIKMLQLSNIELTEQIEKEVDQNPALEFEERENEYADEIDHMITDKSELVTRKSTVPDEPFPDDFFLPDRPFIPSSRNAGDDPKREFIENTVTREETLREYLLRQMRFLDLTPGEMRTGEVLIDRVDSKGYLSTPVEEIAADFSIPPEELLRVLAHIQTLDPPGVGARDLKECLLIQLKNGGAPPLAERIVREYLNELRMSRFEDIAKKLKVQPSKVKEAFTAISKLEPYPGRPFPSGEIKYIIPEVIVREKDGEYEVHPNSASIPRLKLNSLMERLARKNNTDKGTRDFAAEKVQAARNFIHSIEQRENTLIRVSKFILEEQREFFAKGPKYLKPLTLKDVSAALNLHESTISRITSSKYIQTPHGVFSLKFFFSNSIPMEGDPPVSGTGVKEMIKEIIEGEGGKKHLSDQKIANILAKRGIRIARRTVAKYRKELHILPSNLRR